MKQTSAEKALRLVRRYARIQTRIAEWKRKVPDLFDLCEKAVYDGDQVVGSGCMCGLRDAKDAGQMANRIFGTYSKTSDSVVRAESDSELSSTKSAG